MYILFTRARPVTLFFALLFAAATARLSAVELTVNNFSGVAREAEPVTIGIPLPLGWQDNPAELHLQDAQGKPVPLQVDVNANWRDGSIMWALLDFPADVDANSSSIYNLERGKPADPVAASPLKLDKNAGGYSVVTGPIKVVLDGGGKPIVQGIWLDYNDDGAFEEKEQVAAAVSSGLINGIDAISGEPFSEALGGQRKIIVEEQGPQKVQLLVSGKLTGIDGTELLDYDLRLFFFAGSSEIRAQVSVCNTKVAQQIDDRWRLGVEGSVQVGKLELNLQFLSGQEPPQMTVGSLFDGVGFEARQIPLERSLKIQQESSGGANWFHRNHVDKDNLIPMAYRGYKIFYGEQEISTGDRPAPWISVEDGRKGMAVAVRGFWQNFPKALEVDKQEVVSVSLWPHREGGPHELQGGERKTHELAICFQTGAGPGDKFDHWSSVTMRSYLEPVVAWASSDWYMNSGVFGLGVAYNPGQLQEYEWLAQAPVMDEKYNIYKGREFIDEYGWRNYGDFLADNEPDETSGPNKNKLTLSHWNLAFDYGWGMLLQGVRTASDAPEIARRWWNAASEGVCHLADIDINHSEKDEEGRYALGGRYYHTHHGVNAGRANHRSSPEEALWADLNWPWGRGVNNIDPFFYDSRGMCYYSLMSGDRQVRSSAMNVADLVEYSIRNDRNPQIENHTRQAGNNLQVLTDAWIITRDDRYRKAADKVVEKSHAHLFGLAPGYEPAQVELNGLGFCSIFFDALARYVEVSEKVFGIRQKNAIESMRAYTLFITKYMWDEEAGIFYHHVSKGLEGGRNTGVLTYRVVDALLYALPYLESEPDKKLLLDRTARAFKTANKINLAGEMGYRFIANKNSNFIINGGPRCGWYMLNGN